MELLLLGLLGFAGATLLVQGLAIGLAYAMPRVGPDEVGPPPGAEVAIVIAARDEAEEIGGCLGSVRRSALRPTELVVVDGASTDGTREVVGGFPEARLLPEPPLPAGWVGKNWACHVGATATRAPLLLFLDADVRLHPQAIGTAAGIAERDGVAAVSYATRIEMAGFWERVVLPFYVQMTLTYFRAPRTNRPDSRAAVLNGQFLLIRRSAYDALGGHAAVASAILEDVALARRLRSAGRPMRLLWAPELAWTRMYRGRHEMFEGLLRTSYDTRFSPVRQVAMLLGLVGFFLLPLGLLPFGVWEGSALLTGVGAFLWIALFGKHALFARAIGGRARDGLLYPVAVGFYVALLLASLAAGLKGRPTRWKGRAYAAAPVAPDPPGPPTA